MYLEAGRSLRETETIDAAPTRGHFDLAQPKRVDPGRPYHSALLYRIMTTGAGRMPMIGSSEPDDEGIRLIRDWIASLAAETPAAPAAISGRDDPALAARLATTSGAMELALVTATPGTPGPLRGAIVELASSSPHLPTRDLFERFLPAAQRRNVLGLDIQPGAILARAGDIQRGRTLFYSENGAQCQTCHAISGQGGDFGPDLDAIGSKYDRATLLDHILAPSKWIDAAWQARTIETRDGAVLAGFIVRLDGETLELKTGAGATARLATASIQLEKPMTLSLMPEGLLQALTAQEAADLLAFLESRR
jgi:putative heme-binding domain-containing protein